MEDRHICDLDLGKTGLGRSLIAVCDGHSGAYSAELAARRIPAALMESPRFLPQFRVFGEKGYQANANGSPAPTPAVMSPKPSVGAHLATLAEDRTPPGHSRTGSQVSAGSQESTPPNAGGQATPGAPGAMIRHSRSASVSSEHHGLGAAAIPKSMTKTVGPGSPVWSSGSC